MICHFYLKEWKLKKVEKLKVNLHNEKEYVIHIRDLKQAQDHGLVLKKVHRVMKFNQKALLNPYVHMNTELIKNAKNYIEKIFFQVAE